MRVQTIRHLPSIAIVLFCGSSILCPCSTEAATWFVPAQVPTIQAAIDSASSGDSVLVSAGTYSEQLLILAKNIALIGAGASVTTISGIGLPSGESLLSVTSSDDQGTVIGPIDSTAIISGFSFVQAGDSTVLMGGAMQVYGEQCSPTILANRFIDNVAITGGAMAIHGFATPIIELNYFEGNLATDSGGALASRTGAAPRVDGNIFYNNAAVTTGSKVGTGGGVAVNLFSSTAFIINNIFHSNDAGYGGAIVVNVGADALIQNNTLVANSSHRTEPHRAAGIRIDGSTTSATIHSNIVAFNNNGWGIDVSGGSVTLLCNDFWANDLGDYSGIAAGPSDISGDPRFCSMSPDNLYLAPDSPCLDAVGCGLIGARGVGSCSVTSTPDRKPRPSQVAIAASLLPTGLIRVYATSGIHSSLHGTIRIFDVRGRSLNSVPIILTNSEAILDVRPTTWRRTSRGVYYLLLSTEVGTATCSVVYCP